MERKAFPGNQAFLRKNGGKKSFFLGKRKHEYHVCEKEEHVYGHQSQKEYKLL